MGAFGLLFLLLWLPVCSKYQDATEIQKDTDRDSSHSATDRAALSTRRRRDSDGVIHRSACREKRFATRGSGRLRISTARASSSFPFTAAARLDTNCSGVVVTDRHVLTAAHCVVLRGKAKKKVRVGFPTPMGSLRWIPVKRIWYPEEWKKQGKPLATFDYALLVLKSKHRRPAIRPLFVMNQTSFLAASNGTMHVLAFDYFHRPEQLFYRMCKADDTRDGLVYSDECSAAEPANGAGIYTPFYDLESDRWLRVLVGILRGTTGHEADQRRLRTEVVWITQNIMEALCGWTERTRYKLCHGAV